METLIVLIPVNASNDARKYCEMIEHNIYHAENTLDVRNQIADEIGSIDRKVIEVETMIDFTERFNNQELDPDAYFICYVIANMPSILS